MEKINVAELLKNCPEGMELDCTMYENVYFGGLSEDKSNEYPITVDIIDGNNNKHTAYLTKEGCWSAHPHAKCVIFPKGKTSWEGFVPPREFKDGDIIFTYSDDYSLVSIFKQFNENKCCTYIDLCIDDNDLFPNTCNLCNIEDIITQRLATEEEKQKLFDAIKSKGYRWNAETKTLIRPVFPKFHEGDWVIDKQGLVHQIENVVENVTNHTFGYDIVGGGYFNDNSDVRLWTIQDARDGDVLAAHECLVLFKKLDGLNIKCYCTYHFMDNQSFYVDTLQNKDAFHPATEEEKKKLFDAIKDNGYKWNTETKTLETLPKFKVGDRIKPIGSDRHYIIKNIGFDRYVLNNDQFLKFTDEHDFELAPNKLVRPKFKVGDRIKHKTHISQGDVVTEIKNTHYILNDEFELPFTFQDEWELAPDKFDITTLVPFESRVLMRSSNAREWTGTIFSHYSNNKFYGCGMCCDQCIPYEGNEHLLGKTDDCDEFFKTWK